MISVSCGLGCRSFFITTQNFVGRVTKGSEYEKEMRIRNKVKMRREVRTRGKRGRGEARNVINGEVWTRSIRNGTLMKNPGSQGGRDKYEA